MTALPPTDGKTPGELLLTPVQYLKGVGPQRAKLLERLGLLTARDILFFFPRDYQDLTDCREVAQLEEGKIQTVQGIVEDVELRNTGTGRCVLGVLLRCGQGFLRGVWFNQPYLRDRFAVGQELMFSGKPKRNDLFWEIVHPTVLRVEEGETSPSAGLAPVYPLTEGVQQWQLRRIVRDVLASHGDLLDEVFPPAFLEAHDLWPLRKALPEIHFPADRPSLLGARRRFVYQELLVLQLALALKRQQQSAARAPAMEATAKIDARIRRLFPFELTAGQQQAIAEIAADMARPVPMNRLLQGDVGSGKTVVAVYAMLLAIAHGHQAVLMAPTEVLARQHVLTLDRLLSGSQVRRAQLTGGLPAKDRNALLVKIAAGEMDLVVGTHAVIQDDVLFAKLGLAVIDEQHKFGVRQRAALRRAGLDPHYLVMTATPIPRTMTLALFGDLDVSILRDGPPGRQKVYTYLASDAQRGRWWDFLIRKLRQGRQAYVIAPLVEESDQLQAASVQEAYESLANGPLEAFRLGLIHGRMAAEEKDRVMESFRHGQIQVLVSTSVVEVGVDVPNATLMTIEAGERFGLAQLHQLRGRISRGAFPGYCCVFADPQSDEARERLAALAATTDGFRLAETDFALRGPGELFGTRQHGLPPLRIADLVRDAELLEEARRDALALTAADPGLAQPEHALLRRMALTRYGKALDLADVG
jgi:ATP-dependent DNA helicase RecG